MNIIRNTRNPLFTAALRVLFVSVMALAAGTASAQAPMKIAVLDMAAALFNSDIAKKVEQEMRTETAEDESKVRALAEEATKLQERLQKDAAVMSEAEQRKVADQIQEIGVQYQFLVQKIQNLLQERRQAFQQTYAQNLLQAITEVVEQENYDIVFRAEGVLHYQDAYDITARVTENLNKQQ
jgi:outer membrane protein